MKKNIIIPIKKAVKINVQNVSGQSFYKQTIAELIYSWRDSETISESISLLLKDVLNEIFCEVYVGCKNKKLKLDVISAITKKNPLAKINSKELCAGADFGYNIFIELEAEAKKGEIKLKKSGK